MASVPKGQWPPKTCEMPDLSGLNSKAILTYTLNRVFAKGGPADPKSNAYVTNFVRLVDKLIVEYERTREALTEFVDSPNNVISPLFVATGACESCITTMIRTINLGRRIRRDPNGPEIAKTIAVLRDTIWSRVNDMRNAVEHIDGQIAKNTWVTGEPLCLLLKHDRLQLIGEEIEYSDLAKWIQQLHDLAETLAQYKESTP